MVSPLQRRRQRIKATVEATRAIQAHADDTGSGDLIKSDSPQPGEWSVVRAAIKKDKAALKGIKPLSDKLAYKARILPQYDDYLARSDAPDDITMQLMVWLFDCGNLQRAMPIALKGVASGAAMPEGFKGDVPTFIADVVLAWSEAQFRIGHSPEPYFSETLDKLINDWHLFEVITAKYYKLAGLMALGKYKANIKHVSEPDALKSARSLFEKAEQQYLKIGVGTRIEQITLRLEKIAQSVPDN